MSFEVGIRWSRSRPVLVKLSAFLRRCQVSPNLASCDAGQFLELLSVAVASFIRFDELRHRPVFDQIERVFVALPSFIRSDEL